MIGDPDLVYAAAPAGVMRIAGFHAPDRAAAAQPGRLAGVVPAGSARSGGKLSRPDVSRMTLPIYELAGFLGAAIIVVAYFAMQQRWLDALDWRFPAANLRGSLLILVSLWFEWNFPSVVIEIFWALISLMGLVRSLAERRRRNLIAARAR